MPNDDLQQTLPTGEPEEKPEGQLDISPPAQAAFDRRLAKHGLTPQAAGDEGGEQPAAPPPARKAAPPPDTRALPPARGHRERLAERQSREELQRRLDSLEETLKSLLPKDPAIDPEANPEEYTAALIRKATLEALEGDPFLKELREERAAALEQRRQFEAETAYVQQWGDEMTGWEAEYQRDHPDLFDGYYDRLHAFIRASDFSQTQLGIPPAAARRETMRGLIALTEKALANNIHPVAYCDALWRQTPEFHPKNGTTTARAHQAAGNREIAERRKAGAAAATLSTTKAPPAPTTAGKMAAAVEDAPSGRGRAAALAKAARAAGPGAKENLRELRRG